MSAEPATTAASGRFLDPRVLMSIRSLELRARVVVEGFWSGLHRSPYHGFSVEFSEYRQYSPGDDPRYVDWRVFARCDRYYLKRFQDETNLRCHLVVDQSRSMDYGSLGHSKAEYAATLAASLAYFLHLQGDAIGLATFDERVREFLPARHRTGHLRRLMLSLERPAAGRGTDLVAPLEQIATLARKRGLIVVISDFLASLERLEKALIQLAAAGHELIVFQVLDPAELSFDFRDPALFEDLESGGVLLVDPGAVRQGYLRRLEEHTEAVEDLCQRLGSSCLRLGTGQALEFALYDFLRARMRRGKSLRRYARQHGGRAGAAARP